MRLLVDGVFFQLAQSGIARVWKSILPRLQQFSDTEICILDRGRSPNIPGIRRVDFPSYSGAYSAADSFLIDQIARDWNADVFSSTYYTTPVSIPSVLMVYDMIPEIFDFDMSARMWQEKVLAISYARSFCSISESTKSDLLKFYPDTAGRPSIAAYCGVDHDVFQPQSRDDVSQFKAHYRLTRPYYLLVGSREQHKNYKNAGILFDAIRAKGRADYDVVCVGGESEIQANFLKGLPKDVAVRKIDIDDKTLALAYGGAEALVFPSLYEGFGMPVAEAMACGCPVITTSLGSLKEVAGDAAELVSGSDKHEVARALDRVREPGRRAELIERGLERAQLFSWDTMAAKFHELLRSTAARGSERATQQFLAEWKRLREIQAAVDVG